MMIVTSFVPGFTHPVLGSCGKDLHFVRLGAGCEWACAGGLDAVVNHIIGAARLMVVEVPFCDVS